MVYCSNAEEWKESQTVSVTLAAKALVNDIGYIFVICVCDCYVHSTHLFTRVNFAISKRRIAIINFHGCPSAEEKKSRWKERCKIEGNPVVIQ